VVGDPGKMVACAGVAKFGLREVARTGNRPHRESGEYRVAQVQRQKFS